MSAHDMTSSSSCIGCGAKSRGTFTHVAGSTSEFVVPFVIVDTLLFWEQQQLEKKMPKNDFEVVPSTR